MGIESAGEDGIDVNGTGGEGVEGGIGLAGGHGRVGRAGEEDFLFQLGGEPEGDGLAVVVIELEGEFRRFKCGPSMLPQTDVGTAVETTLLRPLS